jgi:DNA-binding transcriptional MerR regulator
MDPREYLTVGDLAQRVGVTVRTIQYYDQQGLLSPSARGPQNQRLYVDVDIANLHQIMTLKYLGLSLSEIREHLAAGVTTADVQRLASAQMGELQENFEALLRRMAVLRELSDTTLGQSEVDWDQLASIIEGRDGEGSIFFQLSAAVDDSEGEREHSAGFGEWHNLVAQAVGLVSKGVAPTDPEAQALARRYVAMREQDGSKTAENFILLANTAHGKDDSFDRLRSSVFSFLDAAAQALQDEGTRQA